MFGTFRGPMFVFTLAAAVAAVYLASSTDFIDVETYEPSPAVKSTVERCAVCHGAAGRSNDSRVPHLRAQNEDYLINQLRRFAQPGEADPPSPILRDLNAMRARRSRVMEAHAAGLDDGLIHGVARYYTELPCETESRAAASEPPAGLAWCNDCHAPAKVKDFSNVPSLNGQPADYLEAQLLAFKAVLAKAADGREDARFHHFMSRSVSTISDARIREVAEYFSQQACTR